MRVRYRPYALSSILLALPGPACSGKSRSMSDPSNVAGAESSAGRGGAGLAGASSNGAAGAAMNAASGTPALPPAPDDSCARLGFELEFSTGPYITRSLQEILQTIQHAAECLGSAKRPAQS
jgi:hypothetical protein